MTRRRFAITLTVVVVVFALLAVPVKSICPYGPCSSAPDAQGVHRYYETAPFGVLLIEAVSGVHLPIRYDSGEDIEPVD